MAIVLRYFGYVKIFLTKIMPYFIRFLDDSKKYSIGAAILIGKGFGGYVSIFSVVGPKNERLPCAIANSPFVDWEAHSLFCFNMFMIFFTSSYYFKK